MDAKERIIEAVLGLLDEVEDPDSITVRMIAEKAKVGIGLINYHFQSRENLLYQAVGSKMTEMAVMLQSAGSTAADPVVKLKKMLIELTDFGAKYEKIMKITVNYELQKGNTNAPLFIVPVLKEIRPDKEEMELRILAFEIVTALQAASLNYKDFQLFSGLDLLSKTQRDKFIGILIDNALGCTK